VLHCIHWSSTCKSKPPQGRGELAATLLWELALFTEENKPPDALRLALGFIKLYERFFVFNVFRGSRVDAPIRSLCRQKERRFTNQQKGKRKAENKQDPVGEGHTSHLCRVPAVTRESSTPLPKTLTWYAFRTSQPPASRAPLILTAICHWKKTPKNRTGTTRRAFRDFKTKSVLSLFTIAPLLRCRDACSQSRRWICPPSQTTCSRKCDRLPPLPSSSASSWSIRSHAHLRFCICVD